MVNERITAIFKPAASQNAIWACEKIVVRIQQRCLICSLHTARQIQDDRFALVSKLGFIRRAIVVLTRFACRRKKDAFGRLKRLDKRANISNLKCTYVYPNLTCTYGISRDIRKLCAALSTRRLPPLSVKNRDQSARCLSTQKGRSLGTVTSLEQQHRLRESFL